MPSHLPRDHSLLRLFLRYYAPPTLLFLILAGLFLHYSWGRHLDELHRHEQIILVQPANELQRILADRTNELNHLVLMTSMTAYLADPTQANRSRLTEDLLAFARTAKVFLQVDVIDATGQERIRINQTPDGPYALPDNELKSRADRYYFKEINTLENGQVYFSSFDLKKQQGKVQTPHTPVIRLAAPLFDHAENRMGSLFFYYLGEDLLQRIATNRSHPYSLQYLLNSDGYWIYAPDSALTWGFMLDRPDLTMAQRHPAAWQRIKAADAGQFRDHDGIWTFTTVKPLDSPASSASVHRTTWKMVYHIPTTKLDEAFQKLALPVYITTTLVLLLVAGGAWQLARAHYHRQQMELSAREQLRKIDLLLNSTAEGMYAIDLQGTCFMANHACAVLLGYADIAELLNRPMHELIHYRRKDGTPYPASECKAHQAIDIGTKTTVEDEVFWRKDGTPLPVSYTALPIRDDNETAGMVCVFRDITERLKTEQERVALEEQLRHVQRLESVGQLSSGIAHDFNNILQIISGNAQMLQLLARSAGKEQPAQLADIMTAVERGSTLICSMLAFARRQSLSIMRHDLNQLLMESELLVIKLLKDGQRLQFALHDRPIMVNVDGTLMQQVLFNLITNARDAIPDGGTITVRTGICDFGQDEIRQYGFGIPGRYAFMAVSDTGQGISAEIRQKIFEPFFTTKETGKGTGLGLAMVYGTIKQHDGFILLDSEPGAGATFRILLPPVPEQTDTPREGVPTDGSYTGD